MSSRSRSVHKTPSKKSNRAGQSKSSTRSAPSTKSKHATRSGSSLPRSASSISQSSSKKRTRSTASQKPSKSIISTKKIKDESQVPQVPQASQALQLPQKKPSPKKVKVQNVPCSSGPDFYTNVLGPTADETILVGLQTFMKFCQECPDNYEENMLVDSGTGLSTKDSAELTDSSIKAEEEILITDTSEKEDSVKDLSRMSVSIKEEVEVKETKESNISEKESIPEDISIYETDKESTNEQRNSNLEEVEQIHNYMSPEKDETQNNTKQNTPSPSEPSNNQDLSQDLTLEQIGNTSKVDNLSQELTRQQMESASKPDNTSNQLQVSIAQESSIQQAEISSQNQNKSITSRLTLEQSQDMQNSSRHTQESSKLQMQRSSQQDHISRKSQDSQQQTEDNISRLSQGQSQRSGQQSILGQSIGTAESIRPEEEQSDVIGEESENVVAEESISKASNHSSELQTPSYSSSQESQTEQPKVRNDLSQTGSNVEIGSSQTSEVSLSNEESQTPQPDLKTGSSQAKSYRETTSQIGKPSQLSKNSQMGKSSQISRHSQNSKSSQGSNDAQIFQAHRSEKCHPCVNRRIEKGQANVRGPAYDSSTSSSKLKDSSESCTCCPCVHSADTTTSSSGPPVKITTCSCSSCKMRLIQKPASRRSCLKPVTKCRCGNSLTATPSRASFIAPPPKRHVRVCCDCSPTSSLTVSVEDTDDNTEKPATGQMGDTDEGGVKVRYAITKITKFFSYTTFEVMRSTKKKPKVMPKSLEGVFVLKNSAAKTNTQIISS